MTRVYVGEPTGTPPTMKDLHKLHELKGVTHVTLTPATPAHVDWSQITPHLPRKWGKIGKPFAIPTGALFVVSQDVPYVGKRFTILQYHTGTDKILGFEPYGRQVSYGTNKDARRAIEKEAARINAGEDVDPEPERIDLGAIHDDAEPTDRRQDQAVNGG